MTLKLKNTSPEKPAIDLSKTPVSRLFFSYYFPAVVSMLSVTVHQIADGLILGQKVGKDGVAAIGLYAPVLIIFIAIVLMLMIGGGILFAKNIGLGRPDKALEVFQFATTISLVLGGIVALSAPWLAEPMTRLLAGNESGKVFTYTLDYTFWALLWLPIFLLRVLWGGFTNNDQAPKVSRNATLLASVCNIGLDLLFVMVFNWGVAGASIATGISLLIALLYIGFYIAKGKKNLHFQGFRLRFRLGEWQQFFLLGLPSFASEIAFAVGFIIVNQSLIGYGKLAVAAFGVINYLSFIFFRFLVAVFIAMQPIISFNVGAGKPDRVLAILKFCMLFALGLGCFITLLGSFTSQPLLHLFSGNASSAFYELANPAFSIYFWLFVGLGVNNVLSLYLQTIGKTLLAIAMNVTRSIGLVLLFVWFLPSVMGIHGIWAAKPVAELATILLMGAFTLVYRKHYYSHDAIVQQNKN
ncbi:MATE family efflux transporter [Microscilla marina]|uniref:Na+ driven multidrug efflux pump, putative n=1 Tax=Microscilla marina ATCC 23134 TaxID=313606 RepID=A1ZRD0_MICM2|nr:MATE family efflux transporter [Microscilla marina]EAY27020.1 Na+ driven multidrug efflux pump, putative [Microscilla marina ATCC 23134]